MDILCTASGESNFAGGQSKHATPSGEDRDILFAVDSVGHRGCHHATLRVRGPELLTVVGAIGFEIALRGP